VTGMKKETNQKAAGGVVIHTGRRAEEAGCSEGSCQESASSSEPA